MKRTTTYIFALGLFLFFGCLSGPNSSRINERDPDTKHFKPIFSDLNIRASTTEKKIVVSWRNRSNYNEGFIVKRRYSSKDKFESVDTVSTNSYIEMVTNYSMGMEFQVSSYYLWDNKIRLGQSSETENINFGTLTNIGYFSGASSDTVTVQWFRETAFDDRVTIEYKERNLSNWTPIVTVQQNEINGQFHRTNFVLPKGKTYDFRIEAALQNYKDEYETFFTREFSLKHE